MEVLELSEDLWVVLDCAHRLQLVVQADVLQTSQKLSKFLFAWALHNQAVDELQSGVPDVVVPLGVQAVHKLCERRLQLAAGKRGGGFRNVTVAGSTIFLTRHLDEVEEAKLLDLLVLLRDALPQNDEDLGVLAHVLNRRWVVVKPREGLQDEALQSPVAKLDELGHLLGAIVLIETINEGLSRVPQRGLNHLETVNQLALGLGS